MSRAIGKRKQQAAALVNNRNAANPWRSLYSNQVAISGTPPTKLDAAPFSDLQDFNPNSKTFGQFFFMVGFSMVGGADLIQ